MKLMDASLDVRLLLLIYADGAQKNSLNFMILHRTAVSTNQSELSKPYWTSSRGITHNFVRITSLGYFYASSPFSSRASNKVSKAASIEL